jgi:DNA polymerase III subunit epsilon
MILKIPLNQANIDHHHFYLTDHLTHFPKTVIGGKSRAERAPDTVTLTGSHGESVSTDIDGTKHFFRARGWVRRLFETANARCGDCVAIEKIGTRQYRVAVVKA